MFRSIHIPTMALVYLALCPLQAAWASTISSINDAAFDNIRVLDFGAQSDGAISGSETFFSDFGISSVTAVGDSLSYRKPDVPGFLSGYANPRAMYVSGPVSSPAGDLVLVSPGTDNLTLASASTEFTFNLSNFADKIGFEFLVDGGASSTFDFFSNGAFLGQGDCTVSPGTNCFFQSSDPFDEVKVTMNAGYSILGISDISLDDPVSAVPVPAAAWLFGSALLGLGVIKRRY